MATKRCRAGNWHYTIRRSGLLPTPVYLSFDTEEEGDKYVAAVEAMLDQGIVPDGLVRERSPTDRRLRHHVRAYLDAQHISHDDRDYLRIAISRLPTTLELRDLSFTWATQWVTDLKRVQNLSPNTIRHHVGAVARCLDWVAAHGSIPFNPLRMLPKGYSTYSPEDSRLVLRICGAAKQDQERDRRLRDGEEDAIRRVLAGEKPDGRQRPLELRHAASLTLMLDLALESAMRMRETYTLTWPQVDFRQRTVFLDKTKNGHKRQVPLSTVAVAALQTYQAAHSDTFGDRLFPWWDGSPDKDYLKKVSSLLSRQFDRIFTAAGCVDLNYHDMRHEATSRIFERTDLPTFQIMKITGHSSERQLARYANLRGSDLAMRLW